MPATQHPAVRYVQRAIEDAGFIYVQGLAQFTFKIYDDSRLRCSWLGIEFDPNRDEVTLIVDRLYDDATNHMDVVRALHKVTLAYDKPLPRKSRPAPDESGQLGLSL